MKLYYAEDDEGPSIFVDRTDPADVGGHPVPGSVAIAVQDHDGAELVRMSFTNPDHLDVLARAVNSALLEMHVLEKKRAELAAKEAS